MKHSAFVYGAILLSISAVAGVLAGCSGASAPSALPQPASPTRPAESHALKSWAAAGLGPQNLLYVSNENGFVNIYRYWQKNLVGVLTNFTKPMGMCVDNHHNVYIADFGAEKIVEYAHGGSTPIKKFDDKPYAPYGCAVDASTGDLAVANFGEPGERSTYRSVEYGNIAIYKHGNDKPVLYGKGSHFTSLSYDDRGDLLAAIYYRYLGPAQTAFYYLPKRGTQLVLMGLPNDQFSSSFYGWPTVESINYDGRYWVVTAQNTMYRYAIDIKAKEVDYMKLTGASGDVGQLWLYRKTRKARATQVVAGDSAYYRNSTNTVDFWDYPVSGVPIASISSDLDGPYGVTVSLRTSE